MISGINGSADSLPKKLQAQKKPKAQINFMGRAQIIEKVPYGATRSVIRTFERSTKATFLETLSKILHRPVDELINIYKIKDPQKLNQDFATLKNTAAKLEELKEISPKLSKKLRPSLQKNFEEMFIPFLRKKGFINKHNNLKNIPARFAILGEGTNVVKNDLTKLADNVLILNGIKFKHIKGRKISTRGFVDEKINITAHEINSRNTTFNKMSADDIRGHNLNGDILYSEVGDVRATGKNNVRTTYAKHNIFMDNLTGERAITKEGSIILGGEGNKVETLVTQKYLEARNLNAKSVYSGEGAVRLVGTKNEVDDIYANARCELNNTTTNNVTSVTDNIYVNGDKNEIKGRASAKKFKVDGKVIVRKPTQLSADAPILFTAKNLGNIVYNQLKPILRKIKKMYTS